MHCLPFGKEHGKRNVPVAVHGARALLMLATNVSHAGVMVDLRLAVFEPAAFCRCVEVVSDFFPIGHLADKVSGPFP